MGIQSVRQKNLTTLAVSGEPASDLPELLQNYLDDPRIDPHPLGLVDMDAHRDTLLQWLPNVIRADPLPHARWAQTSSSEVLALCGVKLSVQRLENCRKAYGLPSPYERSRGSMDNQFATFLNVNVDTGLAIIPWQQHVGDAYICMSDGSPFPKSAAFFLWDWLNVVMDIYGGSLDNATRITRIQRSFRMRLTKQCESWRRGDEDEDRRAFLDVNPQLAPTAAEAAQEAEEAAAALAWAERLGVE